jgi:intein-encoded DNA endonuclease-like protein
MYRRYSLQITSKQFAENVVKCGLIGKGNCADFPKIQEKYYWDFIRGLFDGDGSIVSNRIGKRVTFLGTEQIIIFIHNFFIKKNKFIPTKLLRRFKLKNGFLSQFSIHRINEIEIIFKKMYKHSTRISRLHRKYKKFIEVLSLGIVKRPHWKMKHQ